jgi:hypothetical protein
MPWRVRDQQIVLAFQGGLGNQLFEWAFARALEDQGREIFFDGSRCRGDRPLVVGPLLAREQRLSWLSGVTLALAQKRGMLNDRSSIRLVKQRKSGYDNSVVERLAGRSYLLGYFQSPRYFEASRSTIDASIRGLLNDMLTPSGAALANRLRADEHSVAVHVRRGDYLTDSGATARHGVLDGGYYDRALAHLDGLGHRNRVWFGDDPDWIRANLVRGADVVCPVDSTVSDGGEIALMASCSSRVIANSSFSWWAGWLGPPSTPTHPVIAPAAWFADEHSDAGDLIPDEWLRL